MPFPLPLSPFETYSLLDDSPEYPMAFSIQLRFMGRFQRAALEAAFRSALDRHPLLTAQVRMADSGTEEWVLSEVQRPELQWDREIELLEVPLNPRAGTSLRCGVSEQGGASELWLLLHHACCDGLGVLQFLEDWLLVYHNSQVAPALQTPLRELDPQALSRRGELPHRDLPRSTTMARSARAIWKAGAFLVRRPSAVVPPDEACPVDPGGNLPGLRSVQFDPGATARLHAEARRQGATLNELLLRELLLSLAEWDSRLGRGRPADRLRIAVPMSMRAPSHKCVPAANIVGISFLEFPRSDCADRQKLLAAIHAEMSGFKHRRFGTFLRAMQVIGSRPLLRRLIPLDRGHVTTVLSNLGTIFGDGRLPRHDGHFAPGGVLLTDLEIRLPLKASMPVGFTVWVLDGALKVCLSYDRRRFTAAATDEFFSIFVESLRQSQQDREASREPHEAMSP